MAEKDELTPIRRSNLALWMEEGGVTRTSLADRLGVGRAYTSLLFNETRYFGSKAARSIEKKLYMPTGFLDAAPGTVPLSVSEWSTPADLPSNVFALVPRIAVQVAAGSGAIVDVEEHLPPLAFRKHWLDKKQITSRDNLRIVTVKGDSMSPYLMDHDVAMIDTGQVDQIQDNHIYAIEHSGDVRIKRLSKRFDGGVLIRSDAPGYPEESLSAKDAKSLRVIGKLVWRAG
jgi:phage repressor protein C with HTH and peptisase S24 domain